MEGRREQWRRRGECRGEERAIEGKGSVKSRQRSEEGRKGKDKGGVTGGEKGKAVK